MDARDRLTLLMSLAGQNVTLKLNTANVRSA
jgi:hypothetical protein